MLDFSNRGHLLKLDLEHDVHEIQLMIENRFWIQKQSGIKLVKHLYTKCFEQEIKKLLTKHTNDKIKTKEYSINRLL
jgi:hypothetical protein